MFVLSDSHRYGIFCQWLFSLLFGHTADAPPPSISLSPPFGSIYGGAPLTVTLSEQALLMTNDGDVLVDIVCTFDQVETRGMAITTNTALCVTPALANIGFVPFQISVTLGDEEVFTGSSGFVASKCTALIH